MKERHTKPIPILAIPYQQNFNLSNIDELVNMSFMQKRLKVKPTIFVAMSGGVDSSVAAALLKDAAKPKNFEKVFGRPTPKGFRGFDVVGAHMKCYNLDGCGEHDAEDARRVAEQLGIPFYTFDFEKEYKDRVVKYMVDGYKKGITPNPDVMCNKEIKFGLFLEKALSLGADYVATGHYVRLREVKSKKANVKRYNLCAAKDKNKDQSYFLWTLTQKQLKHCLFPIGDYTKPKVRQMAKKFGLLTAVKKDSQGICFLGQVGIEDFLKKYIKAKPGQVLDAAGHVIGTHRGAAFYTIGQRHGLTIKNNELGITNNGTKDTLPHYVVSKDVKNNTLTVAEGDANPALYQKEVHLAGVNFISNPHTPYSIPHTLSVLAHVRYRQPLARALLRYNLKPKTYTLVFDKPQKYVAPGQSAVFYTVKGEMLGGGIIV